MGRAAENKISPDMTIPSFVCAEMTAEANEGGYLLDVSRLFTGVKKALYPSSFS